MNHEQCFSLLLSLMNVKLESSSHVSLQDSQVFWQAHLTLPYSQYLTVRVSALFLVNQSQSCTFPLSILNLKAESSTQGAVGALEREGVSEGESLGNVDGTSLGVSEGIALGAMEGSSEGASEGESLGNVDGADVTEGMLVSLGGSDGAGVSEGMLLGAMEGSSEGA